MLIVVDMQYEFDAHKKVLRNCIKHIKNAIKKNELIIVLEYKNFIIQNSNTHKSILKILSKYNNYFILHKDNSDGSEVIFKFLKENSYEFPMTTKICGVELSCCVNKTLTGLAKNKLNSKFILLKNSVADSPYRPDYVDELSFQRLPNVYIQ